MLGNVTLRSSVASSRALGSPLLLARCIKSSPTVASAPVALRQRQLHILSQWSIAARSEQSSISRDNQIAASAQIFQVPVPTNFRGRSLSSAQGLSRYSFPRHGDGWSILAQRRPFSESSRKEPLEKAESPNGDEHSAATPGPAPESLKSGKGLYARLPSITNYHRPTREELLAAATGFWSRLKIRFKWFSIRSARPFNSDEIGALFSWVLLGHIIWIILGTTTFASLVILTFNTVFAQEKLAGWIGNYLTKSSGVTVVFESAIVPRWRDGVISFKNVFVSKRPGRANARVRKGSPQTAAAAAAASALVENKAPAMQEDEDTNYTQYDLTLNTVNVTLSFAKWFNGQGLLSDVEVKGVRGVIDRSYVHSVEEDVDPKSYRHQHSPGDFEIDSFKMEDFLVTVHQPHGFRPFSVSVFSADLPKLRQRWLFYDFLCANNVSGSFDDSLFTIHPHQVQGRAAALKSETGDIADASSPWVKHSRLRVDSLSIDHLNRGTDGPFSWIHEGVVDLVADVLFPAEADDGLIAMLMSELKNTRVAVSKQRTNVAEQGLAQTIEALMASPPSDAPSQAPKEDRRFMIMDLKVNFHDVRAAVPLFTRDLNYVNSALIRPIVAYINSRNTFIPITCRLAKRVSDFDGSWTLFDSGLLDDLSAEVWLLHRLD